jgi:hypothetical protein
MAAGAGPGAGRPRRAHRSGGHAGVSKAAAAATAGRVGAADTSGIAATGTDLRIGVAGGVGVGADAARATALAGAAAVDAGVTATAGVRSGAQAPRAAGLPRSATRAARPGDAAPGHGPATCRGPHAGAPHAAAAAVAEVPGTASRARRSAGRRRAAIGGDRPGVHRLEGVCPGRDAVLRLVGAGRRAVVRRGLRRCVDVRRCRALAARSDHRGRENDREPETTRTLLHQQAFHQGRQHRPTWAPCAIVFVVARQVLCVDDADPPCRQRSWRE